MNLTTVLFILTLLIVCSTAFARGGRDERTAAAAIVIAAFLSPLVTSHGYAGPEVGLVIVDGGLFLVLALVAMRSKAFWPMWAAGFQLCALAGHLAAAKSSVIVPAAYVETLIIWSYAVLVGLFAGTFLEGRHHHGRG